MRSPFVLAACVLALRAELDDNLLSVSRLGFSEEECNKLKIAKDCLFAAEKSLRSFRFIRKVDDLPESSPASKPNSSSSRAGEADKSEE